MRVALRSNEAGQAIFRLIAGFGAGGYQAALLLVQADFDINRAALSLGLGSGCQECETARKRACDACSATLRQRVHRVQDRAQAMLGASAPATRHVRAKVRYGADRVRADGRMTVYDTAGEVDEFHGTEGQEL